jgi:DNA-directed RNA polymerase subunit M/transcription elongation factor TFIIS
MPATGEMVRMDCPHCGSYVIARGDKLVCGTCGKAVPDDDPRQVALRESWRESKQKEVERAKVADQAAKQDRKRQAREKDTQARDLKECGARVLNIAGQVTGGEYHVVLTLALSAETGAQIGKHVNKQQPKLVGEFTRTFLETSPEVVRVQKHRVQLAKLEKELGAARQAAAAVATARQQSLDKGEIPPVEKLATRDVAGLERDAAYVRELVDSAESAANAAFDTAWQSHQKGDKAKQELEFAEKVREWCKTASPGLPELIASWFTLHQAGEPWVIPAKPRLVIPDRTET